MYYIVVEANPQDPSNPLVKVFPGKRQAVWYANESPNECRLYWVSSDLACHETEADLLVPPA